MSIDKDTVKHISKLARISLDEKKIDILSKDLSSIMKFKIVVLTKFDPFEVFQTSHRPLNFHHDHAQYLIHAFLRAHQ